MTYDHYNVISVWFIYSDDKVAYYFKYERNNWRKTLHNKWTVKDFMAYLIACKTSATSTKKITFLSYVLE